MMVVWLCAHTLTTSPSPASHDAGAAARAAGVTLTTGQPMATSPKKLEHNVRALKSRFQRSDSPTCIVTPGHVTPLIHPIHIE
jgi:hypothetical protein